LFNKIKTEQRSVVQTLVKMKKFFSMAVLMAAFSTLSHAQAVAIPADIKGLLEKHTCYTCHKADKKMVGPAWQDVAKKAYSVKAFTALVYKPVPANWPGYTPMIGLPNVPKADIKKIADWVNGLAAK
jgi:cytochrome c